MTFPYSETNLSEVSARVINACLKCLNEFPTICKNDPMINFPTPQAIGFGVARGTACCLYSGDETLDYSGHLLNLASRLNDIARPGGIVIDGGFLQELIPEPVRSLFKQQKVFVRSIAEESPINILYLDKYVQIPENALSPLIDENWQTVNRKFTAKQFASLTGGWLENLPTAAKAADKIKVTLFIPAPGTGIKGKSTIISFKSFEYWSEGPQPQIRLDILKAKALVPENNKKAIRFKIDYIPKPLPRT